MQKEKSIEYGINSKALVLQKKTVFEEKNISFSLLHKCTLY